MHNLQNLTERTWYIISSNTDGVLGSGYCDPGQQFTTCADNLETFHSEQEQQARLAELDYFDGVDLDINLATLSIAQQRHVLCHRVNTLRSAKLLEPVSFNGHLYDADDKSVSNLTGIIAAVASGITLPNAFTWRTQDNQNIPFNSAMLLQLAATIMTRQNIVYNRSWVLKDLINASEDVTNIDLSTGW